LALVEHPCYPKSSTGKVMTEYIFQGIIVALAAYFGREYFKSIKEDIAQLSSDVAESKKLYTDVLIKYHNLRAGFKQHDEIVKDLQRSRLND
jgi:hypothetical protein